MEIKINKEIRDYQEKLALGLTLKQIILIIVGILITVGLYTSLKSVLPDVAVFIVSLLFGIIPFGAWALFRYQDKSAAEWLKLYLKYLKNPKIYKNHSTNVYAQLLSNIIPDSDDRIIKEVEPEETEVKDNVEN